MRELRAFVVGVSIVLFLAACGGGDGSSPSRLMPAATTFPLRQSWINVLSQAETRSFSISGMISGTSVGGSGAATFGNLISGTFEATPALAKTSVFTGTVEVEGQSAPFGGTSTLYLDSNYQPLGQTGADLYAIVFGVAIIPETARLNDTGRLYETNRYTNSAKNVRLGTATVEYALQSDTPTTALLKLFITNRSINGAVQATIIETYRITTTAAVTRLSEQTIMGADSITVTFQQ